MPESMMWKELCSFEKLLKKQVRYVMYVCQEGYYNPNLLSKLRRECNVARLALVLGSFG